MSSQNLIPRATLFGNPERTSVRISPDGKQIAFLSPHKGVMNVFVAPIDNFENAQPVTFDNSTGIGQYFWAHDNQHLLYLQDNDGDEDFHLYAVDLNTKVATDLTPFEKIAAQVVHLSHRIPGEILVGINDRDEHWFHDVYRINIGTGERQMLIENPGFVGLLADDDFNVKVAMAFTQNAELIILKADASAEDGWAALMEIGAEDVMTTAPIGFDKSGDKLYMIDSRERNTAAFKSLDLNNDDLETIFATELADVSGLMVHPTESTVEAVSYTFDREKWEVFDEVVKADLEFLRSVDGGEIQVTSRTREDDVWTVAFSLDNGPVKYYLFDRKRKSAEFMFSHRPALEGLELANMHSVAIKSRDGLDLVSYLTLPPASDPLGSARPAKPLPMVLLVHGGPWARDNWGYHSEHQLLANRGYAVLSVNFRGSTGFGKDFINAANMEWAGKMHDDLIDAVNWAVAEGVADKDKVAIMGGSYGGYATLVGLTSTPETFVCGVDIVGPSNLISLMMNPPPYWQPIMPMMQTRVGDFMTDEGQAFLDSRSPLTHVDRICRPLLIAQGANDPRVKQEESDQIVAAMNAKGIPVTYVLYPDEGHGFARPENNISFYAITEAFLAEHLGGSYEPIGDSFAGSNFEVPSGVDGVPGLAEGFAAKTT